MSLDSAIQALVVRIRTVFNLHSGRIGQRTKLVSDSTGKITWTFPTAYAAGVLPYISAIVEGQTVAHVATITALSNTQVVLNVMRAKSTTVVVGGVIVPFEAAPTITVHITASLQ